MPSHICIIDAHPDPNPERLVHALCRAYEAGARAGGHHVETVRLADLDIPFLNSAADFARPPPEPIARERQKIAAADHVVFAFPLWLGNLPARAKAFLEQAARDNFFLETGESATQWPRQLMKGKSARVIVTMGMPGLVYRLVMDAGSLKAVERGLLGIAGFRPVRHTILGGVEQASRSKVEGWFADMRELGRMGV